MRAAMLLGLRLAVGTGGQRARSVMVVITSALGVLVLELVWGLAQTRVGNTTAFEKSAVTLLVSGTISMVALPVLVLVATIARLSAQVRDRRLSTLRLLGMSAVDTRVVAASEVGMASLVGGVAGLVVVVAALQLVSGGGVGVDGWDAGSLVPSPLVASAIVVAVVGVSVMTAALPPRLSTRRPLARERGRQQRPVSPLRVVPLLAGFVLCWATRSRLVDRKDTLPPVEVVAILGGVLLLGVGMLLVIPVFMSLVAAVVLRVGRGPGALLLGRRLQTQPAGATRVIAALMVGLFVVVGARGVVETFLTTPQYENAADFVQRGQSAEVTTRPRHADGTVEALRSVRGVHRVTSYPVMVGTTGGKPKRERDQMPVLVATCAQLAAASGALPGCSDHAVSMVNEPFFFHPDADAIKVRSSAENRGHGAPVSISMRGATTIDPAVFHRAFDALEDTPLLVVPPDTPGVADLLPTTDRLVVAHAGPGQFLYDRVEAAGFQVDSSVDLENYDFVQGMLTLVWTLAAVVLSIGLLTFTVAGIDRALGRRRELTALRLLGTPGRLLQWTQWLEAAVPTVAGTLLAIAAGGYAGVTYLQLDDDTIMPLTTAFTLGGAAAVTSMLLAWVTTVGTTARLDPEHIRAE